MGLKLLTNSTVIGTHSAVGLTVGTDVVEVERDWVACGVFLVKKLAIFLFDVVATIWMGEMTGDFVGVNHDQVERGGFCN